MFCYQCQETAKGTGCEIKGVCGKDVGDLSEVNHEVLKSLFITITNANFDAQAIENQIVKMIDLRDELKKQMDDTAFSHAATYSVSDRASMVEKASKVGVLATSNEDIRSLRELIIYGVKGWLLIPIMH